MENHVYDALKILINLSKEAQEKNKNSYRFTFKGWVKEYCTIHVMSARRTGHTEAARKLILEDDMSIGYFCANNYLASDFRKYCLKGQESQIRSRGKLVFCRCFRGNIDEVYFGKNFFDLDAIVVDNSVFLSKKIKDDIYENIMPTLLPGLYGCGEKKEKPFYFIFLQ